MFQVRIMVRSPSGETDILTLFVAHDLRDTKVFIDNGTGKKFCTMIKEDQVTVLPN